MGKNSKEWLDKFEKREDGFVPAISVVLPVNRVDRFFSSAIDSILNQSFQDFELIVVANGCCVQDLSAIRSVCDGNEKIKIINTDVRSLPFALNLGVHVAQGDYIARMDADDFSVSNRLERQIKILENNDRIGVVSSGVDFIDESGNIFQYGNFSELSNDAHKKLLPFICCIAHPTVMIRKSILDRLGGYSFGKFSEDYDLWLRIMREAPEVEFYRFAESLLQYRKHDNQATSSRNLKKIRIYNFSLKVRELLLTGRSVFVFGALLPARVVTLLWK